jgi:hypothetical protein
MLARVHAPADASEDEILEIGLHIPIIQRRNIERK